jgi:plastocyanin
MRKSAIALALFALAPFALAACGGDDEADTAETTEDANPAAEALEVSAPADGSFAFDQDSLESEAGTVNVTFENPAPVAHDFCVEDSGGDEVGCTEIVADGDDSVTTLQLEAGEYTFFCSVAGHREGGMEGPLTVE